MSAGILTFIDRIADAFGAWPTRRSAALEFGPPPAVRYPELERYSDAELIRHDRDELIAQIKRDRLAARRTAGVR